MDYKAGLELGHEHTPRTLSVDWLVVKARHIIVPAFTLFFIGFALLYAGAAMVEFIRPIMSSGSMTEGLIRGLHMGVVALAVYELAHIVYQEYDTLGPPEQMVLRIRRGLLHFVSVVCTALVLEALIMVIKYSQQDLAGFLYYPVAIIVGAALLLIALGVFTRLTDSIRKDGTI